MDSLAIHMSNLSLVPLKRSCHSPAAGGVPAASLISMMHSLSPLKGLGPPMISSPLS